MSKMLKDKSNSLPELQKDTWRNLERWEEKKEKNDSPDFLLIYVLTFIKIFEFLFF